MRDIKLTDDYDLEIKNGDFMIADSDERHVEHLLISKQGEWKNSPLTGCDIQKAQNGSITRMLDRHIRIQLEADGFNIEKLTLSPQGIQIQGEYGKE
ncbi:hypothetical protein ACXA18_09600 [Riemerella anatipestifer]